MTSAVAARSPPTNIRDQAARFLLLIATVAVCSCAVDSRLPFEWSYHHPPRPGSPAALPEGGVWCNSREKAIFMATTGFFTDGCSESRLIDGAYRVMSIEHIAKNDVRVWVVQISDVKDNSLWIPLPDHNWADYSLNRIVIAHEKRTIRWNAGRW